MSRIFKLIHKKSVDKSINHVIFFVRYVYASCDITGSVLYTEW